MGGKGAAGYEAPSPMMRIHAAEGEVSCCPARATRATRVRLPSFMIGESASCYLNVTLVSAMRRYNTARATKWHTEQRRDHVLDENLR